MGGNQEPLPPGQSRPTQDVNFLDFLLTSPEIAKGHASATRVFLGLDTVLFSRSCETKEGLQGNWRPDMPQLVEGLLGEGFALSVLAHASREYVNAALRIYEQQFKFCPSKIFDAAFVLIDYSNACDRGEVFPVLGKETFNNEGKRSVFIDAFLSSIVLPPDTSYVCVPRSHHYASQQGAVFYDTLHV